MRDVLQKKTIAELVAAYPFIDQFFKDNVLDVSRSLHTTFDVFVGGLSAFTLEDSAVDPVRLCDDFYTYIEQMTVFLGMKKADGVSSLTLLPGLDKNGVPESFTSIVLEPSQIISIVGPTGSGKSRLLADIEWTAQDDTPTHRRILINGKNPNTEHRFSPHQKLVAQLSQNMNFVMDLSVEEFITLHAESRTISNIPSVTANIIEAANRLAGESFLLDTPITALSGGQSRALMIADTAILSGSPIVLIDEIENAGIDRKRALDLLVSKDKIILMATHDPTLALLADRRLIIKNGGIARVIETTPEEKMILTELEKIDARINGLRTQLRAGQYLT